jgi:hypothetical protein
MNWALLTADSSNLLSRPILERKIMSGRLLFVCVFVVSFTALSLGFQTLQPIESVTINQNRALLVNGEPFFPIIIWLQDPSNFPSAHLAGINTIAGYWSGSGGTKDVKEYIELVKKDAFYGIMSFNEGLKGNTALLAYIHGDEPDLPHLTSDSEVVPAENLRINSDAPLWKIFDGVPHSWSVLDPLEGAQFTVKLKKSVEVKKLAIWLTISKGLAVAKEVSFIVDGKEIVRATLKNEKGGQEITLKSPVTLNELAFKVISTYPGDNIWGSISEIEGFDSNGDNVLLSPPRNVPRQYPAQVQKEYENIKQADQTRPVFMTVTGYFLDIFNEWSQEQRIKLYPEYIKATDVIGYDIYPIYGWNKPEWLHLVHDGTKELRRLSGDKPVYAWIETSKGGQWTGDLDKQKPVTPTHIKAEVWMAICRGATAIGYFTHIWKPEYKQFGVPPENVKAMKEINDQITRLSPVILSAQAGIDANIKLDGELSGDIMARQYDGSLYLFAVNYDSKQKAGRAVIEAEGLKAGMHIEVVDENRTIEAENGKFTDDFGPLAVHIYKIKL